MTLGTRTCPCPQSPPPSDIPQLGFGVWQVPDDEVDARGHGPRGRLPAHRHRRACTATRTASAGPSSTPTSRATSVGHHQALEQRRTASTPAMQAFDASWTSLRPDASTSTSSTGRCRQGRVRRDVEGDARARCATTAASRRSGSATSSSPHLQRLLDETGECPAINQIELHPCLQQELRDFHAQHGIVTEAWSPLASGGWRARRPGRRRDRPGPRRDPGPGDPALAPPARQRRHPQVGDARAGSTRTSTCSASSSTGRGRRDRGPRPRRAHRPATRDTFDAGA